MTNVNKSFYAILITACIQYVNISNFLPFCFPLFLFI